MAQPPAPGYDLRLLDEATEHLLGYFVRNWFGKYLRRIASNSEFLVKAGIAENLFQPVSPERVRPLFVFDMLDMDNLSFLTGTAFYIYIQHFGANAWLRRPSQYKHVLYLRGYEFEGAYHLAGDAAVGQSTLFTMLFNGKMRKLLGKRLPYFKILSPKDVYWETADAQRDFDDLIAIADRAFLGPYSVVANGASWKQTVLDLMRRMDHYVVYVSSLTPSVLWELDQLDTEDRRKRTTIVFDEQAIRDKDHQLAMQDRMSDVMGPENVVWSKSTEPQAERIDEVRSYLAERFHVTTPEGFEEDFETHLRRIEQSEAELGPGKREVELPYDFGPALPTEKMAQVHALADQVDKVIEAQRGSHEIPSIPMLLNQVQLRIFLGLLLADHGATGRAFADYAAIMDEARSYFANPNPHPGALTPERRDMHLDGLQEHGKIASYYALVFIKYSSPELIGDETQQATTLCNARYDKSCLAVRAYYRKCMAEVS